MKRILIFFLWFLCAGAAIAQQMSFDGISMMQPLKKFQESLKAKGYTPQEVLSFKSEGLPERKYVFSGEFLGETPIAIQPSGVKTQTAEYVERVYVWYKFDNYKEAERFMQNATKQLEQMYPKFKSESLKQNETQLVGEKGYVVIDLLSFGMSDEIENTAYYKWGEVQINFVVTPNGRTEGKRKVE